MSEIAELVAPIATMVAAIMTAANLGARVTGWGFVVFLIGAIAWCTVALTTSQSNLLWSNAFLALVDVLGIWRWLGRQATLADGAAKARRVSAKRETPTLFPVTLLDGAEIVDAAGQIVGRSMGAMAEAQTGSLSYIVVREHTSTAMSARHVAVPWRWLEVKNGGFRLTERGDVLARLAAIDPGAWPATAPL
ncbi:PRC-barrel domain containing protein [Sphingomonas koreensis]|nr:PRC-barrel domain containing protein [Sphingomonas koreensis]